MMEDITSVISQFSSGKNAKSVVVIILVTVLFFALSVSLVSIYADNGDDLIRSTSDANISASIGKSSCAEIQELSMEVAWKSYERNFARREGYFPEASLGTGAEVSLFEGSKHMEYFGTPLYPCVNEERVGFWGDGGKWVCQVGSINSSSVVYSLGSAGNPDFEQNLFNLTGAQIFTFDPTLDAATRERMQALPYLQFFDVGFYGIRPGEKVSRIQTGFAGLDPGLEVARAGAGKYKRVQDIMRELNHTYVDVFKIDCEGCELGVFEDVFTELGSYVAGAPPGGPGGRVLFGQILVEYHTVQQPHILVPALTILTKLGYVLFHEEPNFPYPCCVELAYIHKSLVRR